MARRALTTTATTLTIAASLLLTGCGGGDDSSSGDIKGADKGAGSPTTSASASTSTSSSDVKRPVITLPSTFKLTFENWTSSDGDEQAVLNDAREELRAGYAAIIANDPDSKDVAFYDTEGVLGQTKKWIRSYTGKNLTVIGSLPAFDPKVTMAKTGNGASLTYCTDESKASTKNRKTGEVLGNPAGSDPEVAYVVSLAKSPQGVWQNASVSSKRGGCSK